MPRPPPQPAVSTTPYHIPGLQLSLGTQLTPSLTPWRPLLNTTTTPRGHKRPQSSTEFHPAPGVYLARDLIVGTLPLLDAVIRRLGADERHVGRSARSTLIDGLAASLSTSGRESTLPLGERATSNKEKDETSRAELAQQAETIGRWVVDVVITNAARMEEDGSSAGNGGGDDEDVQIYCRCEGHIWTREVAALLMGPRSDGGLMQLYNEWLHRNILLRDALLPFTNFASVPLVIAPHCSNGIRAIEPARRTFLLEALTGVLPQSAVVELSKVFTAPGLSGARGYAFQYAQGVVLPAFLGADLFAASAEPAEKAYVPLKLLTYHPASIVDDGNGGKDGQGDVLFDYEHASYYHAPRSLLPATRGSSDFSSFSPSSLPTTTRDDGHQSSSIEVIGNSDGQRHVLKLSLQRTAAADSRVGIDTCVSIDIGQIARGWRYAYRARPYGDEESGTCVDTVAFHDAQAVLSQPGLVATSTAATSPAPSSRSASSLSSTEGTAVERSSSEDDSISITKVHVFPVSNPIVALALLGKLYPENMVLLNTSATSTNGDSINTELARTSGVGKGFGGRCVIWQRFATPLQADDHSS